MEGESLLVAFPFIDTPFESFRLRTPDRGNAVSTREGNHLSVTRQDMCLQIKLNHWTNLCSQQTLCVFFISCTLSCSQHVSALIKGHLQVILYNTKYLKESYHLLNVFVQLANKRGFTKQKKAHYESQQWDSNYSQETTIWQPLNVP
jgi:hypothetical protein